MIKVIEARNVHEALSQALYYLDHLGVLRNSRNGEVLVAPGPVVTQYRNPLERVVFWPERDANPFFHIYESLWMLAGRNDVQVLGRYAKQMLEFSDDGYTQHGAYGHRWRNHFGPDGAPPLDQLKKIAKRLIKDPNDRRSVLQMWDCEADLDWDLKDVPCNTTATFQINSRGHLDLTVFCRSNDIIWGCYGANAVHFSYLLEYMALWIGVPVGTLTQVSVNWHGYLSTLAPLKDLPRNSYKDPYQHRHPVPPQAVPLVMTAPSIEHIDGEIFNILQSADQNDWSIRFAASYTWSHILREILRAHEVYRTHSAPEKYTEALRILRNQNQNWDWVLAATQWMERRYKNWDEKQSSKAYSNIAESEASRRLLEKNGEIQ